MIEIFRSLFAPPRHFVLLLAALWIGQYLSEKRIERHAVSKDTLNNLVFYSMVGYVIGGRFFFGVANLSAFTASPLSFFSVNVDLFDPVGALMTALLMGFLYGRRQKLRLWATLDALTLLFATLAIGLSLWHLAAGTAFGSPTTLPWSIQVWNATRHPTQIYELIASLIIFGLIWFRKTNFAAGFEFLLFVTLTASSRLLLEPFRGDSTLILGGIRLAQVIAWIVLAIALLTSEMIRT